MVGADTRDVRTQLWDSCNAKSLDTRVFLQARRKKLVVDSQAARSAAEARSQADSLLEVLVRRSAEEQKIGQRLWQLRQEKVR